MYILQNEAEAAEDKGEKIEQTTAQMAICTHLDSIIFR